MNTQVSRLSLAALALIVALIVATTYWQTWASAGLADRQDNAIQRVAQFTIKRGRIYAAGKRPLLAGNVRRRVKGQTLYFRRYPTRGLFAHIVGYSTQVRSRAGLERSLNDYLTAANTNLNTVVKTALDKLRGQTVTGNDVILTLNARAQNVALHALAGRCGAAVALEPRTGRVLVAATSPTYDPNLVERNYRRAVRSGGRCGALLNRVTSGLYVPGSTFKVVTAAAALDSGKFSLGSTFYDPGYCVEYGKHVQNYDTSRPFGTVTFLQAMQHSINSVFCEIGKRLGARTLVRYAKRFGFYSLPPLETPDDERSASGLYRAGRLFQPKNDFQVDPGRLAFGQERLAVTPLQMAMVAAAVANRGVVMRPHVVERIVMPSGSTVTRTRPEALGRAIKPSTAAALTQMMEAVVSGGTGTAAQIPGVRVAGKTGTAETGVQGRNTTSFVAFAPADAPRVAVAVILENQTGTGGLTAAPVAKTIMEALLGVRRSPNL
jgi:penicillin-binding protein A